MIPNNFYITDVPGEDPNVLVGIGLENFTVLVLVERFEDRYTLDSWCDCCWRPHNPTQDEIDKLRYYAAEYRLTNV